jgi:NADH-quinone oxidoreductase subunit J
MQDTGPQSNPNWWLGVLIVVLLFAGIGLVLVNWEGFSTTATELTNPGGSIVQLGLALVSPDQYLLPFELASILLVAAMIGAIFVAGEKKQ